MKIRPFPKNLRMQLPLTYAGIALLAAVLIGAVLLLVIGNYYQNQENEYLANNARSIAQNIRRSMDHEKIGNEITLPEYQEFFQNQVRSAAFFIQSRIRVLDKDRNVIADSGTPTKAWYIRLPQRSEMATPTPRFTPHR